MPPNKDTSQLQTLIICAFLKAKMDNFVVVKLHEAAVEAIVKINREKYKKYVKKQGQENVSYSKL